MRCCECGGYVTFGKPLITGKTTTYDRNGKHTKFSPRCMPCNMVFTHDICSASADENGWNMPALFQWVSVWRGSRMRMDQ